jgi:hypothetical protein
LGINVFNPDDDTILTIGEAQGRTKIKYEPLEEDGKCCIINFEIDCGTWDKQENEI